MMKKITDNQKKQLDILYRKRKQLENNKQCILDNLKPILEDLEKIRINIDEIELE